MTVGESIRKLRQERGMTAETLAAKLGVPPAVISLWEEDREKPSLEQLLSLKNAFGVSADRLLGVEEGTSALNPHSLDTVCAALAYAMGITPPNRAAEKNPILSDYVDRVFGGEKADRIIMYNPDAIAQWVDAKYPTYLSGVRRATDLEVPLCSVMPSVTPVCFGTMYTGAQPAVHGIQRYEKPVITIETIFDALIAAGKKPALISYGDSSLSHIYLERDMDYYQFNSGEIPAVNAKAMELILRDEYDLIVIYNGNFDSVMHKTGPEDPRALAELRANDLVFTMLCEAVKTHWRHHNTLVGFAMDHGCHEIDGGNGSHGLDMPEDLNILHRYKGYPREKQL